jgi:hypothetical protein
MREQLESVEVDVRENTYESQLRRVGECHDSPCSECRDLAGIRKKSHKNSGFNERQYSFICDEKTPLTF